MPMGLESSSFCLSGRGVKGVDDTSRRGTSQSQMGFIWSLSPGRVPGVEREEVEILGFYRRFIIKCIYMSTGNLLYLNLMYSSEYEHKKFFI